MPAWRTHTYAHTHEHHLIHTPLGKTFFFLTPNFLFCAVFVDTYTHTSSSSKPPPHTAIVPFINSIHSVLFSSLFSVMGLSGECKSNTNRADAIHKRDTFLPFMCKALCACCWFACTHSNKKGDFLKPSIFPGNWMRINGESELLYNQLEAWREKKRQNIYTY